MNYDKVIRKCGDRKKKFSKKKINDIIFYAVMAAFPLAQFVAFYIVVNFNSVFMAFQSIDVQTGAVSFAGLQNFRVFWTELTTMNILPIALKNSIIIFIANILVGTPLALLFSYYIYEKRFASGLFRIVLFLPSIVSSIVLVIMFKTFTERVFPAIWEQLTGNTFDGLLSTTSTRYGTIVFYNIWISFGTNILIYVGAMSRIPEGVCEAAKIDGAGFFREFISITLPMIYSTITTFMIVQVAAIFTNQANVFNFYGEKAEYTCYTFGYYLFRSVVAKSASVRKHVNVMLVCECLWIRIKIFVLRCIYVTKHRRNLIRIFPLILIVCCRMQTLKI